MKTGFLGRVAAIALLATTATAANAAALDDAAAKYKALKVERRGPVVVAKFDNPPEQLLDRASSLELADLFRQVDADPQARVLVFTGARDIFITHYDIREIATMGRTVARAATGASPPAAASSAPPPRPRASGGLATQIEKMGKPVVCAINGRGTSGAGLELALGCDFRLMGKNATLSNPEVEYGIIPGAGGTQRLPRLVGQAFAREIIFTSTPIDAHTAFRMGLVNRVSPEKQLMADAMKLANRLAEMPPHSLKAAKQVLNDTRDTTLQDGFDIESQGFRATASSPESQQIWRDRLGPPGQERNTASSPGGETRN